MRKRKNRKTGLTVILLILVFSISIGYASLSTQVNVSGNATIRYESNSVTVTFDANGGTVNKNTKNVVVGSEYGELPTPTREGYTFFGWSLTQIPIEYQPVEYIESTGTQYIDTDIKPNQNTGIETTFYMTDIRTGALFGGRNAYRNGLYISNWGGTDSGVSYGSSGLLIHSQNFYHAGLKFNEINKIKIKDGIYTNPQDEEIELDNTEFSSNYNLTLFASNNYGSIVDYASIKIYDFKIYDENTIIRNFVPCYRKNDNVIGLYDTVNGVFYTNQGTGTFNKGTNVENIITPTTQVVMNEDHTLYAIWGYNPTVTFNANGGTVNPSTKNINYNSNYGELPTPTKEGYTFIGWKKKNNFIPDEYQEVEYIESNPISYSSGQYIDTGINITENTGFYIDFIISNNFTTTENTANTSWGEIFGVNDTGTSSFVRTMELGTWTGAGNGYLAFGKSGTHGNDSIDAELSNDRIQVSMKNRIYTSPYGNTTEFTTESFTSSNTLYLFARHWGNTVNAYSKMKLYSFKIYNGDTLTKDFVPCYRKSDDVIGLYDKVNGDFYTNQGSGVFNKGDNVNYITANTQVVTNEDHTLYAIWKENEE